MSADTPAEAESCYSEAFTRYDDDDEAITIRDDDDDELIRGEFIR